METIVSIVWDLDDDPSGNVRHIAEHGLAPADVDDVLLNAWDEGVSNQGRPCRYGEAGGRFIKVVFEWIDEEAGVVHPVTAFEVPLPRLD